MAAITYFMATPPEGNHEQLTMLATGDDERDVEDIMVQARRQGWKGALVGKFVSDSAGPYRHMDGKDIFRHHVRQWVKAL